MTATANFVVLPFNSARINGKHLVSNMMGAWAVLNDEEFRLLHSFRVERKTPLFEALYSQGIIADAENVRTIIEDYRRLNANLFSDTSLHIAVVTKRCNLRCTYCQAEGGASSEDMTVETAARVLKYLFDVESKSVTLEFQGGEPLMNWPIIQFLTENARKFNTLGKNLKIVLVSNMLLLDDAKMAFLAEHDVDVCTSLDGPAFIHDQNRVDVAGRGTHAEVLKQVEKFQHKYGRKVNMLPTITRLSLDHPEAIIDEYIRLGQTEIPLRPANNMGFARCSWKDIGYTPEEFNVFYDKAMAYLFKVNAAGHHLSERMARIILTKVLLKRDPGYVDMMNPCGAGRATMVYAPDGGCFPCDESRMLGEDIFKLGDIRTEDYDDMLTKENLLHLLQASCSDLWNYASVYSPWIGVCPVVNYALQKNVVPKISCSPMHQVLTHQFTYAFSRIVDGGENVNILKRWTEGVPYETKG